MKLQILAITLLFSLASLYPSQQGQRNQVTRTAAEILNEVGTDPKTIKNPSDLQKELTATDLADGREPKQDSRRDILTLACMLVREDD